MKKRVLSILLVALMVMGLCTAAFAAVDTTGWTSQATTMTLTKEYTVTSGKPFPAETLSFTVTAADNPDDTAITVSDYTVAAASGSITVNIPSYDTVGLYHYTIKETDGGTQGVTYATNEIAISVLVEYDYDNNCLKATPGVTKDKQGEKEDTFENAYDVGDLTVKKTVIGNLGDKNESFPVKVTLTATGKVYSDITVSGGSAEGNSKTISGDGWTGDKEITIELKDDETVKFANIPAGVTYTVEETNTKGYTATYENKSGTIAKDATAAATITNELSTTVDTGISLDTLPYILIVLAALAAAAVIVIRKRRIAE